MIIKTPIPKIDIERYSKDLINRLERTGSVTASGELSKLGIKAAVIDGLTSFVPSKSGVGPVITLQYMPKDEEEYRK